MNGTTYIQDHPPRDGKDYDCRCARCGSSINTEDCDQCDDGFSGHDCGEDCCACRHPADNVRCGYCDGTGLFRFCLSSSRWCEANPLPGREHVSRGQIEWFEIESEADHAKP